MRGDTLQNNNVTLSKEDQTRQILHNFTHSGKLFVDNETWKVRVALHLFHFIHWTMNKVLHLENSLNLQGYTCIFLDSKGFCEERKPIHSASVYLVMV